MPGKPTFGENVTSHIVYKDGILRDSSSHTKHVVCVSYLVRVLYPVCIFQSAVRSPCFKLTGFGSFRSPCRFPTQICQTCSLPELARFLGIMKASKKSLWALHYQPPAISACVYLLLRILISKRRLSNFSPVILERRLRQALVTYLLKRVNQKTWQGSVLPSTGDQQTFFAAHHLICSRR